MVQRVLFPEMEQGLLFVGVELAPTQESTFTKFGPQEAALCPGEWIAICDCCLFKARTPASGMQEATSIALQRHNRTNGIHCNRNHICRSPKIVVGRVPDKE